MAHIAYTPKVAVQTITDAEYHLIKRLCTRASYNYCDKIGAIKFLKEQYNLGLYEAKSIVDKIDETSTPEAAAIYNGVRY
jgi:ribosomal protein L7/L12